MRTWISGAGVVILVLLLQHIGHCGTQETRYTKCCGLGQVYNEDLECSEASEARDEQLAVFDGTKSVNRSGLPTVAPPMWCNGTMYLFGTNGTIYLQTTGDVYLSETELVPSTDYCVEYYVENEALDIIMCELEYQHDSQLAAHKSIGMMVSMPFLLITFLVYAMLPELRNLHGKSLMCYVATLLLAYIFLVTVQLGQNVINETYCVVASFIIYFVFMVSFLWLNVMCIDIWWTFSGRRGFSGSIRQSEQRRFLVYSVYAWGVPSIMLAVCLGLQYSPSVPDSILKPRLGETRCWFPDDRTVGWYFYYPIIAIILCNVALFSWTTWRIFRVHQDTDRSMRHDSQRHGDDTDHQHYKLYLKLMLVFGVNWTMEIVSWVAGGPDWRWYITDLCNALYGVFIFFVFLFKKNVWRLIKKRYHVLMGRPYRAKSYAPSSGTTRVTGMSSGGGDTNNSATFHSMAIS